MKNYLVLFAAIVMETFATSCLKQSGQFTRLWPSVLTVLGYAGSFYCLSHAVWSAVGIVLVSLIGRFVFKQHLDAPAIIGIALIIVGVVVINLFSKSAAH